MFGRTGAVSAVGVACIVAVVLSGCGGGGGGGGTSPSPVAPSPAPPPAAPTVTAVTVTGAGCTAAAMPAGVIRPVCTADLLATTFQLAATATMSDGTTQTVTNTAQWSSTNTSVATVSAQGLVAIVGRGEADVTALYQGKLGGQTIRANLKPLIAPISRGTTFQGRAILIQTEKFGRAPNIIDGVSSWGVVVYITLNDGRIVQMTDQSVGRADIAADGSFRKTEADGGYLEGIYPWDGSVSGTFQVHLDWEGVRYTVTGAYTARPSATLTAGDVANAEWRVPQ
ncbi:MAG: Ig-like domain-containing protein [Vicinamibacterales bacterium]|nr:Ig-like domain-containing protein [Vicinamibacterales bacterium]